MKTSDTILQVYKVAHKLTRRHVAGYTLQWARYTTSYRWQHCFTDMPSY